MNSAYEVTQGSIHFNEAACKRPGRADLSAPTVLSSFIWHEAHGFSGRSTEIFTCHMNFDGVLR